MPLVLALLLAQFSVQQDGALKGNVNGVNCIGPGTVCSIVQGKWQLSSSGGGGGGAPTTAQYWVGAADGTLSAEKNLGVLGTGLVINTGGTPSIYAGASCAAGNYASAVSASGALTCSVPPSGGGNSVSVTVAFGTGDTTASTVVTGQAWVTLASIITCTPTLLAASGRAEGAEDAVIEAVTGAVHTRVAGTGFTLTVGKPGSGLLYGSFVFHCIGV